MSLRYDLYQAGNSWLHRLDPRVKLLMVACALAGLLTLGNVWLLLGALALSQVALARAGVARRRRAWVWKMLLPTLLMVAILWIIFDHSKGPALFAFWFVEVTGLGIAHGVAMAARLATLAFVVFAWLFTTDQGALVRSMVALGLPYSWGLTLAMALRYLPTMAGIFSMIVEAQQARALILEGKGLLKRARAYVPVTVAMVITALRTADHLARALESRALGAASTRTYYRPLAMRRADWVAGLALILFTGAYFVARFALGVGAHPLRLWG